jgi:hypothetical protein
MIPPSGFPAVVMPLGFGATDGGGTPPVVEVATAYGGVGGVPVGPSIAEISSVDARRAGDFESTGAGDFSAADSSRNFKRCNTLY